MAAVREWETSAGGILYPGANFGHTDPIAPSAGGERYEAFVRKHIRQSKGRWRRQPLEFYGQQSAFHHELLRTEGGRRIVNEALYGVSRKNGKTTDVAALALFFLVGDGEPAPEVYGAAGSRDQAKMMLEEAKRMVRASEFLSEWCKVTRNEITVPSIDGVYRAVSAEAGLQMGSNPSAVVADELHVWKGDSGRELWDALTTGMDARQDPIAVAITTAGYDKDSIAYDVFVRMLEGDPETLLYWIGAVDDELAERFGIKADALDDFDVWRRVNPAPWLTRKHFERQRRRNPAAVFARLHLNMWTAAKQAWLPIGAWKACANPDMRIRPGERVWIGVDIGIRRDHTAVVEVALREVVVAGKRVRRYIVHAYHFAPAESGGRVDFEPVERLIRDLVELREVQELRYDPQFFQRTASDLSEIVRTVEIPPHNNRVAPMSQFMYDVIIDGELVHDGDAKLAKHVANVVVRETDYGWRISKGKSDEQIDSAYALMLALGGAQGKATASPGARPPKDTTLSEGVGEQATRRELKRYAQLKDKALRNVRMGALVECTKADYESIIRTALQDYAGECIDGGDHLRAQIAYREVQRLDGIHGFAIG